jgi:hypothetical protein
MTFNDMLKYLTSTFSVLNIFLVFLVKVIVAL